MTICQFKHRPARKWLRISLTCGPEMGEIAAALISELTGTGIEIKEDTIIGYLLQDKNHSPPEQLLDALNRELKNLFPDAPSPTIDCAVIAEEDWATTWREHFKTNRIGSRLVIKPTWESHEPIGNEVIIELDPAMAFGTGTHASTRLVLELLDEHFLKDPPAKNFRVLDLGTGTGILAMAAAKLGAQKVMAIDNDPDAVAAARENTAQNSLTDLITVSSQDIHDLAGPFDLIMANLTLDILSELAPTIVSLLSFPGSLIVSGILQGEQEEAIIRTYTAHGLELKKKRGQEEWIALLFGATTQSREHISRE